MSVEQLHLLKVRLETMKNTLCNVTTSDKNQRITKVVAERFNKTLAEVREASPDIRDHLPTEITSSSPQNRVGFADAKYLDLEMFIDEVIALINAVESGR